MKTRGTADPEGRAGPGLSTRAAEWNTKSLGYRAAADAASAASAAALVAPVISIIDRSIMENASGRASLRASLHASLRTLVLRPHTLLFSRPCALLFLVYSGTYLAANGVDTAASTLQGRPAAAVTAGTAKFAVSSAANVGLCVYKDRVFARMFGPAAAAAAAARAVPLATSALFAGRDCLTVFASFNVPPLLGPYLAARLPAEVRRHVGGQTAAQFAAPALVQLVSTPVHLLGLDLYNRPSGAPGAPGWADRWRAVRRNWAVSTVARICRIVPAFGVGGVVNAKVRRGLMERLE